MTNPLFSKLLRRLPRPPPPPPPKPAPRAPVQPKAPQSTRGTESSFTPAPAPRAAAAPRARPAASPDTAQLVARHAAPEAQARLGQGLSAPVPAGKGVGLMQLRALTQQHERSLTAAGVATSDLQRQGVLYGREGAGTPLTHSIAAMALNGGKLDTGADGRANCTELVAYTQQQLAQQDPPVSAEAVSAQDHTVLRLPGGVYFDPTRAVDGSGRNPILTSEEAAPYEGVDGVTLQEREEMERGALARAEALGPNATSAQRLEAARKGADASARTLVSDGTRGELSATTLANNSGVPFTLAPPPGMPAVPLPSPGTSAEVTLAQSNGQQVSGQVTVGNVQEGVGQTPTVQYTFELELSQGAELGGSKGPVSGSVGVRAGERLTYQVVVPEAQSEQWQRDGLTQVPNPLTPSSIPPGGGVSFTAESFLSQEAGLEVSRGYLGLWGDTSAGQSQGVTVGVQNVSDTQAQPPTNVMRVYVGPTEAVNSQLTVGGGVTAGSLRVGAEVGHEQEARGTNLQVAEFDMNTPEGRAAYDIFMSTGKLPEPSGTGSRVGTITQYSQSSVGSAGGVFEVEGTGVSVDAELWNNGANHTVTRWDDGTVVVQLDGNFADKQGRYTKTFPPGGEPTTEIAYGNRMNRSDATVYNVLWTTGANVQGPPVLESDHYVQVTMSESEALELRDWAQEYVAAHPDRRHSVDGGFLYALSQAKTPEDVMFVLYTNPPTENMTVQLKLLSEFKGGAPLPGSVQVQPAD